MPSVLSHPAPMLCIGLALGRTRVPPRLLLAGLACSLLPDLDVIGFKFGVSYADILGHRGFSHSLLFALLTGLLAAWAAPLLRCARRAAFLFCGGAVLLHIMLDALTNGGLGVALFWPLSETRWFFPWQPIEVSPFSLRRFLSRRGMEILYSEFIWVWLPSFGAALLAWAFVRHKNSRPGLLAQKRGGRRAG